MFGYLLFNRLTCESVFVTQTHQDNVADASVGIAPSGLANDLASDLASGLASGFAGTSGSLEACALGCERGGRELFRNLEFSLSAGVVLTVGGANGAGKTSLLRILAGLAQAAAGEVRWGGVSIHRCATEYREALSYLGHVPGTRRDETPFDHVSSRLKLGLSPAKLPIADALERVGLRRFAGIPCGELSVGQNRRAALAWLIARGSPLWILDEPLSGLDVDGQALVASVIAEHALAGGYTVLTTHQPVPFAAPVEQQSLVITDVSAVGSLIVDSYGDSA